MPPQGPSPALFFETISSYQRTEALKAAIELDLFSPMANGPKSVAELADACHASPRGIRVLLDYMTILGFLHKNQDLYDLTDDSKVFLVRKSPAFLGDSIGFMLAPVQKNCFEQLTAAVRKGGTVVTDEGTVSHDNPIWVQFARYMAPLMHMPARLLAGLIGGDRSEPLRVLDVAAGHGLYGITVAEQYRNAHVTALDWPNVLAVAKENAQRAGVSDRHQLIPGSAFDVDWGGPYDIVLLTNFLHHFDVPTCEKLAAKAFAALAPNGRTLTLEFIPNADRVSPPSTANFALVMLATTPQGDAYTFAELETIFAHAGFQRSEFHPLPPTTQQAVVSYKR